MCTGKRHQSVEIDGFLLSVAVMVLTGFVSAMISVENLPAGKRRADDFGPEYISVGGVQRFPAV
jgi:hypothetical protein